MEAGLDDLYRFVREHQSQLLISASVAIAVAVVLSWTRRLLGRALSRVPKAAPWPAIVAATGAALRLFPLWVAIISAYAALQVSPAPEAVRAHVGRLLLALSTLSLGVAALRFTRRVVRALSEHGGWPPALARAITAIGGSVIGVVVALSLLQVWGVPTAPLLVLTAFLFVLALVALRDVLPTVVASIQVTLVDRVRPGDYITLEGGDEGTVESLDWRGLVLRSVDGRTLHVPHTRVVRQLRVRRGPPLRRAAMPLRFVHRSHLRELTGCSARNLAELVEGLRKIPDSAIYYHTHQYLEEHQYLVPCPANAFAEWVGSALGLEAVAEELASVRVLDVAKLATVREGIIEILQAAVERHGGDRSALPGHELYFVKSVTVVTPCPYTASDLQELLGVVRRLSLSSLFYHLFEARLFGGAEAEADIPTWLRRQLDEGELAAEIGRLSPWDYTFEGLRQALLQRIEARL